MKEDLKIENPPSKEVSVLTSRSWSLRQAHGGIDFICSFKFFVEEKILIYHEFEPVNKYSIAKLALGTGLQRWTAYKSYTHLPSLKNLSLSHNVSKFHMV